MPIPARLHLAAAAALDGVALALSSSTLQWLVSACLGACILLLGWSYRVGQSVQRVSGLEHQLRQHTDDHITTAEVRAIAQRLDALHHDLRELRALLTRPTGA